MAFGAVKRLIVPLISSDGAARLRQLRLELRRADRLTLSTIACCVSDRSSTGVSKARRTVSPPAAQVEAEVEVEVEVVVVVVVVDESHRRWRAAATPPPQPRLRLLLRQTARR